MLRSGAENCCLHGGDKARLAVLVERRQLGLVRQALLDKQRSSVERAFKVRLQRRVALPLGMALMDAVQCSAVQCSAVRADLCLEQVEGTAARIEKDRPLTVTQTNTQTSDSFY